MTAVRRTLIAATIFLCGSGISQAATWAEKMFAKLEHDFGVVARASEVSYRFEITNIYKDAVHISNVRTTCGCSAGVPSKTTLASREKGFIEVSMNTEKFTRRKDSSVIVTFDAPLYAEVRIPITAYIRTDVVLAPGAADFGNVEVGKEAHRTISVNYAGRDDWTISGVETRNPHIEASVVEKGRGGGRAAYELQVTLKPTAPIGSFRDQLFLLTDDLNSPKVPVLVEANVEADITVTIASLGLLTPGKAKTINVVFRGRDAFTIEEIRCDSATGNFQYRRPTTAQRVHVVPLTITPPEAPGRFDETFTVKIEGRPQPLTFHAEGTIVAAAAAR